MCCWLWIEAMLLETEGVSLSRAVLLEVVRHASIHVAHHVGMHASLSHRHCSVFIQSETAGRAVEWSEVVGTHVRLHLLLELMLHLALHGGVHLAV